MRQLDNDLKISNLDDAKKYLDEIKSFYRFSLANVGHGVQMQINLKILEIELKIMKLNGLCNQHRNGVPISTLSDEDIAKKLYPLQMRENIINSANSMTEKKECVKSSKIPI